MALVQGDHLDFNGNASFYGLVVQNGPFEHAYVDRRRHPKLTTGNGIGRGGTAHAGHAEWDSLITPYTASAPSPTPATYQKLSVITPMPVKKSKKFGMSAVLPQRHPLHPESVKNQETQYEQNVETMPNPDYTIPQTAFLTEHRIAERMPSLAGSTSSEGSMQSIYYPVESPKEEYVPPAQENYFGVLHEAMNRGEQMEIREGKESFRHDELDTIGKQEINSSRSSVMLTFDPEQGYVVQNGFKRVKTTVPPRERKIHPRSLSMGTLTDRLAKELKGKLEAASTISPSSRKSSISSTGSTPRLSLAGPEPARRKRSVGQTGERGEDSIRKIVKKAKLTVDTKDLPEPFSKERGRRRNVEMKSAPRRHDFIPDRKLRKKK